jgi:hypothetical protein
MHRQHQLIFTHRFPSSLIFRDKFFFLFDVVLCDVNKAFAKHAGRCLWVKEKKVPSFQADEIVNQTVFLCPSLRFNVHLTFLSRTTQRMLQVFYFFLSSKKRFSFILSRSTYDPCVQGKKFMSFHSIDPSS